MSTFDFIPYMRTLATNLKELRHTTTDTHFTRIMSLAEMEEFLASSRSLTGAQLVVLDKPSGRLDDSSQSDNLIDRRFFTYYVLKKVANADYDEAETVKKAAESIARKIMSRMFRDKRANTNGLLDLQRSSFYYDAIGPIAHGYFGVMVSFSIYNSARIVYTANDWLDG